MGEALLRHEPADEQRERPVDGQTERRRVRSRSSGPPGGTRVVSTPLPSTRTRPRRVGRSPGSDVLVDRQDRAGAPEHQPGEAAEHHPLHQPHHERRVVHEADVPVHDVRRPQQPGTTAPPPSWSGRARRGCARGRPAAPRGAGSTSSHGENTGNGTPNRPRGRSSPHPDGAHAVLVAHARPDSRHALLTQRDLPAPRRASPRVSAATTVSSPPDVRQALVGDVEHALRGSGQPGSMPGVTYCAVAALTACPPMRRRRLGAQVSPYPGEGAVDSVQTETPEPQRERRALVPARAAGDRRSSSSSSRSPHSWSPAFRDQVALSVTHQPEQYVELSFARSARTGRPGRLRTPWRDRRCPLRRRQPPRAQPGSRVASGRRPGRQGEGAAQGRHRRSTPGETAEVTQASSVPAAAPVTTSRSRCPTSTSRCSPTAPEGDREGRASSPRGSRRTPGGVEQYAAWVAAHAARRAVTRSP